MKLHWGYILLVVSVIAAACESDPTNSEPVLDRYIIPGDTTFPEGITTDQGARTYFVGSTSTGTIYRGNANDSIASLFSIGGSDGRTTVVGMKLDSRSRLFAAGGPTGTVYVYNSKTGVFIARLASTLPADSTFVNDVAVAASGVVYGTDSFNPVIYRITEESSGALRLEDWLPLDGTPIVYRQGFNLNGIAVTPDDQYLLTVQSNTGRLYRIKAADKSISEVSIGADSLTNGDGLLLDGRTLYVVRNRNQEIVKLQMSDDYSSGSVVSRTTNSSFAYPTTIARLDGRLLVVNGQLDKRSTETHTLPFTLSSIPIP